MSGKLNKMIIRVFKKEDFSKENQAESFTIPVNPETLNQNFKIGLEKSQGQGQQQTDPQYVATPPEELKIDFTLDGTGTIEGYAYPDEGDKSVQRQLELFFKAVYEMDSETHKPNYLIIQWGKMSFSCLLSTIDLNYTLFEADGSPLRVKVSAAFISYKSAKKREQEMRKKSPDLTKIKRVKAGDRLDNMTYEIYNDVNFLSQIAKANGLTSFRNLTIGAELVFPPLDKTEGI